MAWFHRIPVTCDSEDATTLAGGCGYTWVRENFVNFSTGTPNPCLGVIYKLYNPSKVCELPSKPLVFAVRHGAMGGHGGVFEGCSIRCGGDTIM
jgi:hypothetical protein